MATPNTSWSWTKDFYNACKKLTADSDGDGNKDTFGVVGMPNWDLLRATIFGFGGQITDRTYQKVQYIEKPAIDAIDFTVRIHKEGLAETPKYQFKEDDFSTWTVINGISTMGFFHGLPSNIPSFFKSQGVTFEYGAIPVPKGPKYSIPETDASIVAIIKGSKNKKEAADLISFLATVKGQLSVAGINEQGGLRLPTTISALKALKFSNLTDKAVNNSYQTGKARAVWKNYMDLERFMIADVEKLIRGEITLYELKSNGETKGLKVLTGK
jgi:ABC-type glycerol-3-phosphate transport system substrate-binding protein